MIVGEPWVGDRVIKIADELCVVILGREGVEETKYQDGDEEFIHK